jgi:hypothetical protein
LLKLCNSAGDDCKFAQNYLKEEKRPIGGLTCDPNAAGYPCVHDAESGDPGYFIGATALHHEAQVRSDGCSPLSYIDADTVPFFVLPKGGFGMINVGVRE